MGCGETVLSLRRAFFKKIAHFQRKKTDEPG